MKLLFICFITTFTFQAWGYANFIGHGYTSCVNCHYNPFGGGQLNDYGRAVSATAISSRFLYPSSVKEEDLAYMSGFLFRKPRQDVLRLQANYRGFNLYTNPGGSQQVKRWIPMQKDIRATLTWGGRKQWIASGEYGAVPYPEFPGEGLDKRYFQSRSYFLGYKVNEKIGVYAGLMDKVYGLRIVEHVAFSRSIPKVTQNNTVHGVNAHYLNRDWEGGMAAYLGNLEQDVEYRHKGGSLMLEKTILGSHRLGGSVLKTQSDLEKIFSYALHGRFNLKEGSALLMEAGQTKQGNIPQNSEATSRYGLLQTYLRPLRGLYFFSNIEYINRDIDQSDYSVRFGPGVQFFPAQRMELRADLYNTRNHSDDNTRKDAWMLLLQTHIWL